MDACPDCGEPMVHLIGQGEDVYLCENDACDVERISTPFFDVQRRSRGGS